MASDNGERYRALMSIQEPLESYSKCINHLWTHHFFFVTHLNKSSLVDVIKVSSKPWLGFLSFRMDIVLIVFPSLN